MRTATAALLVVTLAVCVFICLLFHGASKSGREWKAQNLMLRQKWMQIVRLFAVDETATALFHGDRGLIGGIVTYENSEPTKEATVYAVPLGQPIIGPYPQGDTDQLGHFAIEISPAWFGRFAVIAKKENENYPPMNQFFGDGKFETVTLTPQHRAATVRIRLRPKAGVIVGTVTDAVTRSPLNPCVEFRRGKEFRNFLTGTGLVNANYRVLIPSDTDVLMKVWYQGHKPWYYPGTIDEGRRRPLKLKPGELTRIDIRLVPYKKAQPIECGMPVGTAIRP